MKTICFPIMDSSLNNFIHQMMLFRYDMDFGEGILRNSRITNGRLVIRLFFTTDF
jgi:hypothetical protein